MTMREVDLRRVPLSVVMTRGPATVEEAAPVSDAAAEMAAGGFRHLPVVDATGALVGMISERDLRARLGTDVARFADATADALAEPVLEAMTPDPVSLPPTAMLAEALEVFADERVGAIPVVDDADRPIGIVSYVDLLGMLRELSEVVARRAAAAPGRSVPARRHAPRPRRGPRSRAGAAWGETSSPSSASGAD
jgi:CBS domain-containing protein